MLCDCKPALQQIENAHRKGMPEGLRDWERGGLLEATAYYRSKLEAVAARRAELRRKAKEAERTRERQAAAAAQNEAEESDATEEEATRESTTRRGRPRGGTKVAARIGERLRREIGRGGRPRVGDG